MENLQQKETQQQKSGITELTQDLHNKISLTAFYQKLIIIVILISFLFGALGGAVGMALVSKSSKFQKYLGKMV